MRADGLIILTSLLCGIVLGCLLTLLGKWVMKKITLVILSEVQEFTWEKEDLHWDDVEAIKNIVKALR